MAERKIREAIEKNEFDGIGGIDKKIDNKKYFSTPREYRMTYHILRNSGILPEETEIKKYLEQISKMIKQSNNPSVIKELYHEQLHLQTKYNLLMEMRKDY